MVHKMSWLEIKIQARWLYNAAYGFKRSILLITCISAFTSLMGVWSTLLIKSLIDVAVGNQQGNIPETMLIFALSLISVIGLNLLQNILSSKSKTSQANHLQSQLFRKIMIADWQTLSARHSGDYCNRMISDVEAVNRFLLSSIPDTIATIIQLLATAWLLIHLEPLLAILAMAITPIFLLLMRFFARPMREATVRIQNIKGENLSLSQESIQNIITIRAFERQEDTCNRLSRLHSNLLYWILRQIKLNTLSNSIQSASWSATYALTLMWGITRLSQKAISYGGMAAYLQLVTQVQRPIRQLVAQIPQMITTSASIGRLIEVLDMPEEIFDKCSSAFTCPLGIALKNVCFAYKEGGSVLGNLDMEVNSGAMTALIGTTGAGKSTVVRLLLGLVKPQSGSILLYRPDGESYPICACTRSAFTYVQQGNTAISGTIADNLLIAKPTATIEEMETVLKQACAWDFVSDLPHKTESRIGEHGIGLSEGQQQRLAIARALLRDAPILLLDEATSALDKKTESQVLKNIQSALQGRTCLIITHRSAALKLCSRVYRLSDGKAYLSTTYFKSNNARFRIKRSRSYFKAASAS